MRVLVTGATGYVGGRLVPALLAAGHEVRVLVRDPSRVAGRAWAGQVEVVAGDVLDPQTLGAAVTGIDAAYYLVHSMAGAGPFEERDVVAAENFGNAAKAAAVERVIYLGGLGDAAHGELSPHLASRQETGERLRACGPALTEFRAGIIVGSGSLSLEMIRYLTERLPVMICPRWAFNRVQPIAIADVIRYLVTALRTPSSVGKVVEIGGADVLTYRDMMLEYARHRGLRRLIIPVPVLTPRLSSHWIHWVTPISIHIARPLVEGLRTDVLVTSDLAHRLFPDIRPLAYADALDAALAALDRGDIGSSWSDALASSARDPKAVVMSTEEGMVFERRQVDVAAPQDAVFRSFTGLGGARGWLYADWLWKVRGILDRALGGVGLRRGRRDADALRVGDAVDFWRVEAVQPGSLLRLRAEMRLPGRAWLEFRAVPVDGHTRLMQTAYFAPRGLAGHLYWWALYPFHKVMFSRMVERIGERARRIAASARPDDARRSRC